MKVPLLTSKLLSVPHGFSMRQGGVSVGCYESLNLGFHVGDDPKCVEENIRRLAHSGGMEPVSLHTVNQVHGDVVAVCRQAENAPSDRILPPMGEADALWTSARGQGVAIRTADCVPILLVDPIGQRVAAIHSGWKGTELRIAARTVETWVREGADPSAMIAAIGPAIGPCCYEVSSELAVRFHKVFGAGAHIQRHERHFLDLPSLVRRTLMETGLKSERIDSLAHCTSCDSNRFFSHRRTHGHTGRHMAFVVCEF